MCSTRHRDGLTLDTNTKAFWLLDSSVHCSLYGGVMDALDARDRDACWSFM